MLVFDTWFEHLLWKAQVTYVSENICWNCRSEINYLFIVAAGNNI